MNNNVKEGSGRGAKLMFGDVPVFYTPWLNFSYSGERKSGFLAPLTVLTLRLVSIYLFHFIGTLRLI